MIVHAVGLHHMFAELLPQERHRLCMMLGVDELDLEIVFVTFLRRGLTDDARHEKLKHSQRELAEYADALASQGSLLEGL